MSYHVKNKALSQSFDLLYQDLCSFESMYLGLMQYFVQYCSCNCCHAGVSGSQLLGGLLLHTTRNTVTKSCHDKFSKFLTSCTYNHTLYDKSTGQVVVLATTSGGLAPYGVNPFFLESSFTYDASLAVCKPSFPVRTLYRCTCTDWQHFLPLSLALLHPAAFIQCASSFLHCQQHHSSVRKGVSLLCCQLVTVMPCADDHSKYVP